jgi:ParB family chromosome partitioning protein
MTAKNIMMNIDEIKIGSRHRKDLGDLHGLARSIAENGLLHPPVVRSDGVLIAGQRRAEACKLLGWTEIPVRVIDLEHVVFSEQAGNLDRKNFTPEERVAVALEIEKVLGERRGRPPSNEAPAEIPQEFADLKKGQETAAFVTKAVGFGNAETLRQAKAVVDAAARHPEKHGPALAQMNASGRIAPAFMKSSGKSAGKLNGRQSSNGGLWDQEQELIGNFSDLEWSALAAISPTIRTYVGFDDIDTLDDESWDALQTSLIEAKQRIDAFMRQF